MAKKKAVMPKTVTRGLILYIVEDGQIEFESVGLTPRQEKNILTDALVPTTKRADEYDDQIASLAYERGKLDGAEAFATILNPDLDAAGA